ncbi:MAG: P-loop NTPase [Candidatus Nezhaarchaeota archaeon]|nr:P-loop NTPase [Candidatus Nezhaarchaeota archaeon]
MSIAVAVTGGKGGVGKSAVAANLAAALWRMGHRTLLVDSDVENPNLHLFLDVNPRRIMPISVFTPDFDLGKCTKCGKCIEACPEKAIALEEYGGVRVLGEVCIGCKVCYYACPQESIRGGARGIGYIRAAVKNGLRLIAGELKPTESRSALAIYKLMRVVKDDIKREKYDFIIVDTPPGVCSSVLQALRIANVAVAISEPTPLGLETMRMTVNMLNTMKLGWIAFINKSGISQGCEEELLSLCRESGAQRIFLMPYDEEVFKINMSYKLLVESDHPFKKVLLDLADHIRELAPTRANGFQPKNGGSKRLGSFINPHQ